MPKVRIRELGSVGLQSDVPPAAIPVNALSGGSNVRAYHGRLMNFPGYATYATPPIEPYGLFGFETAFAGDLLWLQAGLAKLYVYDGNTHTEVTRTASDYNTNEYFDRWTGGVQNGLGFLCNASDSPQQWDKVDPGTRFKDMMYDPQASAGSQTWGELGNRAFAMRAFGETILAMNLQEGSNFFPSTVSWCDFIQPGNTSPDWVQRATNSARRLELGDTLGAIIDGAPLRDDFIVYKEDAVYRLSITGDTNRPFAARALPQYARILNRNCIGDAREFHVIASSEDIYVFDGNVFRSLLDHRRREFYRNNLWDERILTTFVSVLAQDKEVWICFTTPGAPSEAKSPDRAIVWNYHDNTLSDTDLPNVRDMSPGVLGAPPGDAFDDPPNITFDDDTMAFNEGLYSPGQSWLVGAHGSNLSVFGLDQTANGTPKICQGERIGLVPMDDQTGDQIASGMYAFKSLRPYLSTNVPVEFRLGGMLTQDGPVNWMPYQTFDPRSQDHLRFRANGRYVCWGVRSNANARWELTDIEIDYERMTTR